MSIYPIIEQVLQVWIVVIAFQSDAGIRHVGQLEVVFTTEDKCEAYAKDVMFDYHHRINGLYWWCEEVRVNP